MNSYSDEEKKLLLKKYRHKKTNAKQRSIEFSLSFEDYLQFGYKLLGRGECDYTNLPFGKKETDPMYPSLERIESNKGYVRGNVCVVGREVNNLKDILFDRTDRITLFRTPVHTKIIKGMMLTLNEKYIEYLKKKIYSYKLSRSYINHDKS